MDLYNKVRPSSTMNMQPTSDFLSRIPMMIEASLAGAETNTLPHCLLFHAEEPGVGKTTAARLIAIELNPSLPEDEKLAILEGRKNTVCREINGADCRKIEDARQIADEIEALQNSLYSYNYVFIINEVHQLLEDSIQVLLAPLENIPKNVYFIATTTELGLVMSDRNGKKRISGKALMSRVQAHHFHKLSDQEFTMWLNDIAKGEGFPTPLRSDIVNRIREHSGHSLRNALQLLSKHLMGMSIDTDYATGEDASPTIATFFDLLEKRELAKQADPGLSWFRAFNPMLQQIIGNGDPDDVRVEMLKFVYKAITDSGYLTNKYKDGTQLKALFTMYGRCAKMLNEPVTYPFRSSFVARVFTFIHEQW